VPVRSIHVITYSQILFYVSYAYKTHYALLFWTVSQCIGTYTDLLDISDICLVMLVLFKVKCTISRNNVFSYLMILQGQG